MPPSVLWNLKWFQAWYLYWARELRSRAAALEFNVGMATGTAVLTSIRYATSVYHNNDDLELAGLTVEGLTSTKAYDEILTTDPLVSAE